MTDSYFMILNQAEYDMIKKEYDTPFLDSSNEFISYLCKDIKLNEDNEYVYDDHNIKLHHTTRQSYKHGSMLKQIGINSEYINPISRVVVTDVHDDKIEKSYLILMHYTKAQFIGTNEFKFRHMSNSSFSFIEEVGYFTSFKEILKAMNIKDPNKNSPIYKYSSTNFVMHYAFCKEDIDRKIEYGNLDSKYMSSSWEKAIDKSSPVFDNKNLVLNENNFKNIFSKSRQLVLLIMQIKLTENKDRMFSTYKRIISYLKTISIDGVDKLFESISDEMLIKLYNYIDTTNSLCNSEKMDLINTILYDFESKVDPGVLLNYLYNSSYNRATAHIFQTQSKYIDTSRINKTQLIKWTDIKGYEEIMNVKRKQTDLNKQIEKFANIIDKAYPSTLSQEISITLFYIHSLTLKQIKTIDFTPLFFVLNKRLISKFEYELAYFDMHLDLISNSKKLRYFYDNFAKFILENNTNKSSRLKMILKSKSIGSFCTFMRESVMTLNDPAVKRTLMQINI